MTALVKATLCEIGADAAAAPVGDPVNVQFNPTSLRVQISNKSAGGQQAGAQARQRPGTGEVQVSFDLIFDTADEGTTEEPVSVSKKTQIVEKFVRPKGNQPSQQTPPRVEFKWGSFVVQGVMESANIELDLFAANGTPLRAKVAVQIKGQDPQYTYAPILPPNASAAPAGGGTSPSTPDASAPAGTPGTEGGVTPSQVAQAMPGESLAQLAARNGLDPSAWRALAAQVANPFSLSAGFEIGLPSSLSIGGGVSGSRGSDPATTAQSLPLVATPASTPVQAANTPAAAPRAPAATPLQKGKAVMRQGGVTSAITHVRSGAHNRQVAAGFRAFGLAQPDTQIVEARPYGQGVPLREQRGANDEAVPVTGDKTTPRWEALPSRSAIFARPLVGKKPIDACACSCGPQLKRMKKGN